MAATREVYGAVTKEFIFFFAAATSPLMGRGPSNFDRCLAHVKAQ